MAHTAEEWHKFRIIWESDPKMNYSDIAKLASCSKQSVQKRASRDKWVKTVSPGRVARKAHAKADRVAQPLSVPEIPADNGAPVVPGPDEALSHAIEEDAVDKRAAIIDRHRREWQLARNRLYGAIQASDFEAMKRSKITSETLKIIQDAERKAWALDVDDPGEAQIIRG